MSSRWTEFYPNMVPVNFALDIVVSIIAFFGCIGNVFTMTIISKWNNISSGAAFMLTLALTDFMSVLYDGIIDMFLNLLGITVKSLNDYMCAFWTFFSWTTTFSSYYITVLFSLDKCLAVWFPFKAIDNLKFNAQLKLIAVFLLKILYRCSKVFPSESYTVC